MKSRKIIVILFLISAGAAQAAVRLGLGNAVAKRSAELINKAGDSNPIVGEAVGATLAYCPAGALFDSLPIDMSMVRGVDPLGHVQPTGHTFPSDHIYYYAS